MKQLTIILAALALAACNPGPQYTWIEDFDGDTYDSGIWSRIPAGSADWNAHMSDYDSLVVVADGVLSLKGIVNPGIEGDERDVITGGLQSRGKKGFGYGRLEVRAKLQGCKSAWPAIWMCPFDNAQWPYGGEIDIIERLNSNDFVYTTCHTAYTYLMKQDDIVKGATGMIDPDDWNVYGLEHYSDRLVWTVNGVPCHSYIKREGSPEEQWPFDREFYLILSMQLGGNWVGPVCTDDLPVEMQIDWIRFTEFQD